jgi:hypothetical protein
MRNTHVHNPEMKWNEAVPAEVMEGGWTHFPTTGIAAAWYVGATKRLEVISMLDEGRESSDHGENDDKEFKPSRSPQNRGHQRGLGQSVRAEASQA